MAAVGDIPKAEREAGLDLLQEAEPLFVQIRAPSRIGVALMTVVLNGFGVEEGHPQYGPAAGAAQMGYSARLARPNSADLADTDRVEACLARGADGELDYELMAEQPDLLRQLAEFMVGLADDRERILRMAGLTDDAWTTFASAATMQLHKTLVRSGVSRRFFPPAEGMENLLRLGYSIRYVDELAGLEPWREGDPLPS